MSIEQKEPVNNAEKNNSEKEKTIKDQRIRANITIYGDKSKRNRYKLTIKGESTLHKNAKSISEEIKYYLDKLS